MTTPEARDRLAALLHEARDNDDRWPDDDAVHTLDDCNVDPEGWRDWADRLLAAGVLLPDVLVKVRAEVLAAGMFVGCGGYGCTEERNEELAAVLAILDRALAAASGTPEPPVCNHFPGQTVCDWCTLAPPPATPGLREALERLLNMPSGPSIEDIDERMAARAQATRALAETPGEPE